MPSTMAHNYKSSLGYDKSPPECPMCHYKIIPIEIASHHYNGVEFSNLQVVFQCVSCNKLFISEYESYYGASEIHYYERSYPAYFEDKIFRKEIMDLSPDFVKIYNQASSAESKELLEICGPGYRKSLEFLIKDYLIHLEPMKEEEIKRKLLSACISSISDHDIKSCAEKATWLGNDETHYIRKWENKDLSDLKILIDLTVNWITNKLLMERYEVEMRQGR